MTELKSYQAYGFNSLQIQETSECKNTWKHSDQNTDLRKLPFSKICGQYLEW